MIIVSQNRDAIINFDNINEIRITKTGNIMLFDNTYRSQDECSDILGQYETEERAKEILQDIIYMYQKQNNDFYYTDSKSINTKFYIGYTRQHKDNTYYMPEK